MPRVTSGWPVAPLELAPLVTEETPRTALAIPASRLRSLSNARLDTARWKKTSLPGTSDRVWPPSVVLKMPTPASESPEAFGSTVPTYAVLPLASFGSMRIEPIAFDCSEAPTDDHGAFLPASALSVTHTPPPAAPM